MGASFPTGSLNNFPVVFLDAVTGVTITDLTVDGNGQGNANYRFIGCSTGACPLTSNPWISTLYGMLLGGMLGGVIK